MKQKTNPSLTYSKVNTVLLILLLGLAIGVLYVTTQQNKNDDMIETSSAEISVDALPSTNR